MLGADYPEMRAELLVEEGDLVPRGRALFRDWKRPDIVFTSPVSGKVTGTSLAGKRRLNSLTIALEGNDVRRFAIPPAPDREKAQQLLLESGMWPGFRARPFGRIPDPGSVPDAIFVTAIDTNPHAADANIVLAEQPEAFADGVGFLKLLTDGPVFVCQAPTEDLVEEDDQVRCVRFSGRHPAGLAGTHIDRLFPIIGKRRVWQINYQDVIILGLLLQTGELHAERVISLAGPAVKQPRLVKLPPGADLDELVAGELTEGEKHLLSGSAIAGRESRFLGRYSWQVTALHRPARAYHRHWFKLLERPARPKPVIPTTALEHALGPDIPVMPLIRALSVGDAETAKDLGCLGLLEEDMALITYATGGAQDFAALLRMNLDALEEAI